MNATNSCASGYISGYYSAGDPLPGFGGFDCSARNCPKGDDVSPRNNYGGDFEVQRVKCIGPPHQSKFTLTIYNQTSNVIYGYYNASQASNE